MQHAARWVVRQAVINIWRQRPTNVAALKSEEGRERKVQKTVRCLRGKREQLHGWTEFFKLSLCVAKLPLKTLNECLECNLKNVGTAPSSSRLQEFYLPRVFENNVNKIKRKAEDLWWDWYCHRDHTDRGERERDSQQVGCFKLTTMWTWIDGKRDSVGLCGFGLGDL